MAETQLLVCRQLWHMVRVVVVMAVVMAVVANAMLAKVMGVSARYEPMVVIMAGICK